MTLTLIAGCGGPSTGGTGAALSVSSPDLASGTYPPALTCDGADRPPAVVWSGGPSRTRAIAIELLDPDAPQGTFTHWLAFMDGAGAGRLVQPFPGSLVQGANSAGKTGYWGPCPPAGSTHHYHLTVLAVSARPPLAPGFSRGQLDAILASSGSTVLARGEMVATYQRS